MRVLSVNTGIARPLRVGTRSFLSAIGKAPVSDAVSVGRLGLQGDEQADPSVHGGLDKAVYAYPVEHLPFWQKQRREAGVSLFDEALPPGFMGENLSIEGLLEHEVWIGDELHFPGCVLRVTAPREPCFKFNAVMGLNQAGKLMMEHLCSGFYLAVAQAGSLEAGQPFRLVPGRRGLRVSEAFAAKRLKHLR
ncbi:MOSC domain-containing protein [Hydrogenophaga sp.]|uniref:MOSC domain-containing protein n=1 Tax=Hydrogenophaga sp. TaxID=1904254 RepID=UPI00271EF87E|nr:MOSC domain-containing protein [Hydrogenophaga sp.]MDO9250181.1 MOSC domain-containing protein [Hydrogenophaga sp.]MDP2405367.1 MOSC domain-containing protein [Hydrogenophaga sp.]MDP3325602.1 MOSC domain-containing protein [Hydrogenophaga sp.]MDP3887604.1 MOSC domain-containing protein [Hydrogenophaga sp.]MDZ4176936.1 MOSC domain-containing protein [Hydrogenophaga sp.]